MTYETLLVEARDGVGLITFNRPQALNALDATMTAELARAVDALEGDDVKAMRDKTFVEAYLEDFITSDWERLAACRKPTIAAVAGFALGGGCEVAMMCDIVIAADTAKFGQPEVTLGIPPGRWHPTADPPYWQGQGHGYVPDRAHDGCRGS